MAGLKNLGKFFRNFVNYGTRSIGSSQGLLPAAFYEVLYILIDMQIRVLKLFSTLYESSVWIISVLLALLNLKPNYFQKACFLSSFLLTEVNIHFKMDMKYSAG